MSSLISGLLSSTVGLLLNKARDRTADKLQDGDVIDAKIRKIVVRELDDIKTKLNGLSRKDLLSSYSFLKEAIHLVYDCLENCDESKEENKTESNLMTEACSLDAGESSGRGKFEILNETQKITLAFGKLQVESSDKFKTAKKGFQNACKEATRAFCNESLSIDDRIFAAKLRIVSKLLECIECHESAITSCLLFLDELHTLAGVREIFNVYITGGPRSLFKKSERLENVRSVMLINYVLYQFIMETRSKYHSALNWPKIELTSESFNPIWEWHRISNRNSWGKKLVSPPNDFYSSYFHESVKFHVNTQGEMVCCDNDDVKVVGKNGEIDVVYQFSHTDMNTGIVEEQVKEFSLDENDNLYVLRESVQDLKWRKKHRIYLQIFSNHFIVKGKVSMTFLGVQGSISNIRLFAVKGKLVVYRETKDKRVYICDYHGILSNQFTPEVIASQEVRAMSCSDDNEIILATKRSIYLYLMDGSLKSTLDLEENIFDMSFYFGHDKFLLLNEAGHLLSCNKLRKIETLQCHHEKILWISSHPSGSICVIGFNGYVKFM